MPKPPERLQVFRCPVCGNIVEVLKAERVTAREFCNLHGLWKA